MSIKYKNLLSPIKIGNVVFRNRMIASRCSPRYVQGSETYPTEAMISHYGNKAKGGAAVVTCGGVGMPHNIPDNELATFSATRVLPGSYDIKDAGCQRYLSHLSEAIHFYGGKASMQIGGYVPVEYDVSMRQRAPGEGISAIRGRKELTPEMLEEITEDFVRQAVLLQEMGFDMVYLHMAYRFQILGRFLSPLTNRRTDRFGGSMANEARFPLMVADGIKKACGPDFIIEASLSGVEPQGGRTLEDTIELAKIFAGHIDLLQIRAGEIDPAHPTGFEPQRMPFLYMTEAIKKSGAKIGVVTVGGYHRPDDCEDVIASGKADFIASARGWISNPDFGQLAYEGRGEDVVPCVRCNGCLRSSNADPLTSVCAVNPVWGLEHKIERMTLAPTRKKKVAVVGGGPAGMKAALVMAKRGHDVTLYEKSQALGGLLKTTDNVSFKWPQRDFKNYLVSQVNKSGIKVLLNTEATADSLGQAGFDAVVVAVGSEPVIPSIPGADGKNVMFAADIYGMEDRLAKDVVVVGGGEVGVETGMHLALKGHNVILLEMRDVLAPESPPSHYYQLFKKAWEELPNFKPVLNARCNRIGPDGVTYVDSEGKETSVKAGSVVLATGMKSKNNDVLKLYGAGDRMYIIGDCNAVGNIQKSMRSGFSTAVTI